MLKNLKSDLNVYIQKEPIGFSQKTPCQMVAFIYQTIIEYSGKTSDETQHNQATTAVYFG
ncbi:MAG TPA: hypothetical protein DSN98_07690 [Thermoplasmata archaeon]|nr:MAG TPA: hypothetical protein DSN98_07690 [Thermoplasmata archaeon]